MPRRKKCRNLQGPPGCNCFKPRGIPAKFLKTVTITLDEYESIRLTDYENLEHEAASSRLGISRPVFTRLVDGARKKIAMAIIEGCELVIEGGEYHFEKKRFRCLGCFRIFETELEEDNPKECPYCHTDLLDNLNVNFGLKGRCHRHGFNE